MGRFSKDEETEFEYRMDVELIDANPIFDFHGTSRHDVPLGIPSSTLGPHSLVDGGPPSAIVTAPRAHWQSQRYLERRPGGRLWLHITGDALVAVCSWPLSPEAVGLCGRLYAAPSEGGTGREGGPQRTET